MVSIQKELHCNSKANAMKKVLFLLIVGISVLNTTAQKLEIKDSTIIILNVYEKSEDITVTSEVFEGLRRIEHTGTDLKVESFTITWVDKGSLITVGHIKRIDPKYIKRILDNMVKKVYFEQVRIKLKDRTIGCVFALNISYP